MSTAYYQLACRLGCGLLADLAIRSLAMRRSKMFPPIPLLLGFLTMLCPTWVYGAQVWSSDCNWGFQDIYAQDQMVCISGELDYIDPGFEFLPDADAYVTENQVWPGGTLADVTLGGANSVVGAGGGGAFFDEVVWLPDLTPGEYDIVMDVNENGIFGTGHFA